MARKRITNKLKGAAVFAASDLQTVLLKDHTVGQVEDAEVGDFVTVTLQDENGNFIEVTGEVEEILEG